MEKEIIVKTIGVGATVVGLVASLVSDMVTKEQMDLKISKEVSKQLETILKKEELL